MSMCMSSSVETDTSKAPPPAGAYGSAKEYIGDRLEAADAPLKPSELADEYGCSSGHCRNILNELRKAGAVERVGHGLYESADGAGSIEDEGEESDEGADEEADTDAEDDAEDVGEGADEGDGDDTEPDDPDTSESSLAEDYERQQGSVGNDGGEAGDDEEEEGHQIVGLDVGGKDAVDLNTDPSIGGRDILVAFAVAAVVVVLISFLARPGENDSEDTDPDEEADETGPDSTGYSPVEA